MIEWKLQSNGAKAIVPDPNNEKIGTDHGGSAMAPQCA